jgi:hypothetical protein
MLDTTPGMSDFNDELVGKIINPGSAAIPD